VINFRNFLDDPESLSVHLFFQISMEHVLNLELLTNSDHGPKVSERASIVFVPLFRVLNELLNLFVNLLVYFRVLI